MPVVEIFRSRIVDPKLERLLILLNAPLNLVSPVPELIVKLYAPEIVELKVISLLEDAKVIFPVKVMPSLYVCVP